jgi:hypothetical protein
MPLASGPAVSGRAQVAEPVTAAPLPRGILIQLALPDHGAAFVVAGGVVLASRSPAARVPGPHVA